MEYNRKYNIYGVNRKYESDYGRNVNHTTRTPEPQKEKEMVITPITKKYVKNDEGIYAVERLPLETKERFEKEKFTESDDIETLFDFYVVKDGDDMEFYDDLNTALAHSGVCWGMADTYQGWKNIAKYNRETKEWVLLR